MDSSKVGKLLFESGLIVFSVLLALILNEYRESSKEDAEKARALQMVHVELKSNLQTLNKWLPYHQTVLQNYQAALEGSEPNLPYNDQHALIMQLMPDGIIQDLLDDSAWEAVQQSSVSANLNIDTIFTLSKLFKIQRQGVTATLNRIITAINSIEQFSEEDSNKALFFLQKQFKELVSQEVYLIEMYQATLQQLQRKGVIQTQ